MSDSMISVESIEARMDELVADLERDAECCVNSMCSLEGCDDKTASQDRLMCVNFTLHLLRRFLVEHVACDA
jgi:hypothetical protein